MAKINVVNPYNFVPFSDKPDREQPSGGEHRNTGWMDITVTPRTCLIIPDPDQVEIEVIAGGNHKKYPFFKIDGKPIVPASSLRGMIRSVFEAASNSCLPFLRDKEDFTMRTPVCAAFKNRGLLEYTEDGGWKLYAAESKCAGTLKKYELNELNGGRWCGLSNADEYDKDKVLQFHKPPFIGENSKYHIMALSPGEEIKKWCDNTPYESLIASINFSLAEKKSNKGKVFTHRSLLNALKDAKENPGRRVPVWYVCVGEGEEAEYFLSPSAVGRVHQRDWEKIMAPYLPCDKRGELCPACRLFGTAEGKGKGSKVRFTDAQYSGSKEPSIKAATLGILSSPKPSAYEFYLNKPNGAIFWNYNYYSKKEGDETRFYPLKGKLMPRGRKFYWHSPAADTSRHNPSGQNATMDYLEPDGAEFKFRIYFDEVTDNELEQLKWVVNFGENNLGKYCHKLGHARPFGFGSVKLIIDSITTREFVWKGEDLTDKVNYSVLEQKEGRCFSPWVEKNTDNAMKEPKRISALLKMANYENVGDHPVMYPAGVKVGKNGEEAFEIFQWFANNRTSGGVGTVLPEADADDITIESYMSSGAADEYTRKASSSDTFVGVIQEIKVRIYVCAEGLDAPCVCEKQRDWSYVKKGEKVAVKLKSSEKNKFGNYDAEIVRYV